jgi:hypothetical protein
VYQSAYLLAEVLEKVRSNNQQIQEMNALLKSQSGGGEGDDAHGRSSSDDGDDGSGGGGDAATELYKELPWPQVTLPGRGWTGTTASPSDPQLATVIDADLDAISRMTYRPEPCWKLSVIYRTQLQDMKGCYEWATSGLSQPMPPLGAQLVIASVRAWRLHDEVCMCAYYTGRIAEGGVACEAARRGLVAEIDQAKREGQVRGVGWLMAVCRFDALKAIEGI